MIGRRGRWWLVVEGHARMPCAAAAAALWATLLQRARSLLWQVMSPLAVPMQQCPMGREASVVITITSPGLTDLGDEPTRSHFFDFVAASEGAVSAPHRRAAGCGVRGSRVLRARAASDGPLEYVP